MRPYRIGPSSGSRVCACCSRRSTGSLATRRRLPSGVRGARQLGARSLSPRSTLGGREVRHRLRPRRPLDRRAALLEDVGRRLVGSRADSDSESGICDSRLLHRLLPFMPAQMQQPDRSELITASHVGRSLQTVVRTATARGVEPLVVSTRTSKSSTSRADALIRCGSESVRCGSSCGHVARCIAVR